MSEMSVKEAYKVMQAACGIEVGDTVKVLRTASESNELGGSAILAPTSDAKFVGSVFEVSAIETGEIKLEGLGHKRWGFPFFCLELVEKAKPELPAGVIFEEGGLTVGGTFVSKDTIRRNLDL